MKDKVFNKKADRLAGCDYWFLDTVFERLREENHA